jgi:hypothetical protein
VIDHDELLLASIDPDPALVELTELITQRLQAGDPVDAADFVKRHPQWAGAIRKLLPTINDLVYYGCAVVRGRAHGEHQGNRNDANEHEY